MKRCALYVRVSTEEQTKNFSIAGQLADLHKTCTDRGYSTSNTLTFIDDGYSGMDWDRPALNRLRDAITAGRVDIVMAYDPDRLARKLSHQLAIADGFEKAQVKLEFVTTEIEDTPEGQMFYHMKGVFADYERTKFLDRSRRGRIQKARSGLIVGGRTPYGYRFIRKTPTDRGGRYVIDETEGAVVRQIFAWLIEGQSTRAIVSMLNARAITPQRSMKGWGKSSVQRLLKYEGYIGITYFNQRKHAVPLNPKPGHKARKNKKTVVHMRPRAEWIRIEIPPILDPEIFVKAQQCLKRNSERLSGHNTVFFYLLKGLLRCGDCGRRYAGCPSHGRKYYRCMGRDRLMTPRCTAGLLHAGKIEDSVWGIVRRFLTETDVLTEKIRAYQQTIKTEVVDIDQQIVKLQRALKDVQTQQARLLDDHLVSKFSAAIVDQKNAQLEKEHRHLEDSLAQLRRKAFVSQGTQSPRQLSQSLRTAFRGLGRLNETGRQQVLRTLLDRITLRGRTLTMVGILPVYRPLHAQVVAGLQPESFRFSLKASLDNNHTQIQIEKELV